MYKPYEEKSFREKKEMKIQIFKEKLNLFKTNSKQSKILKIILKIQSSNQ